MKGRVGLPTDATRRAVAGGSGEGSQDGGASLVGLRTIAVAVGVLLCVAAWFAHPLGLSRNAGFGAFEALVLCVGLAIALSGILPPRSRLAELFYRCTIAVTATYLSLIAAEVVLQVLAPRSAQRGDAAASLKGLYRAVDGLGFDLAPHWSGTFDDGIVRGRIKINSRAARDAEPTAIDPDVQRVLLIGDSFTFGYLLDQSETIDKFIEERSGGKVDAYNLGCGGYGPGEVLEKFRNNPWWNGSDVVYLFFHNDLRDDNSRLGLHTAYDGYVVSRFKPDGTMYEPADYPRLVSAALRRGAERGRSRSVILTVKDTAVLTQLRRRAATLLDSDSGLLSGAVRRYHPDYVDAALVYTRQMQRLATERGLRFHVMIVPSKGETARHRYASFTQSYVSSVREAGIDVIELLGDLSVDDYFAHEGHFDPSGADAAARAILAAISD